MNTAKEKCWLSDDGKTLVADGDPKAAFLFARAGEAVSDKRISEVTNPQDFFVITKVTEEIISEPKAKAEAAEPKAKSEPKSKKQPKAKAEAAE